MKRQEGVGEGIGREKGRREVEKWVIVRLDT